jgi:putative FmdB family regulatory protein
MPIYDYVCETDGEFECLKSLSDRELAECPVCNKPSPLKALQGTNEFAAKTRYRFPPKAQKKFAHEGMIAHRRAKWT